MRHRFAHEERGADLDRGLRHIGGEKGGEVITFLMGGFISGKVSSDTCSAKLESLKLTKEWKRYTVDLKRKDLRNIITGFGFVVTGERNPQGCTFYLDEITYDK